MFSAKLSSHPYRHLTTGLEQIRKYHLDKIFNLSLFNNKIWATIWLESFGVTSNFHHQVQYVFVVKPEMYNKYYYHIALITILSIYHSHISLHAHDREKRNNFFIVQRFRTIVSSCNR